MSYNLITGSSLYELSQDDINRIKKVYSLLRGQGFNQTSACAVLANMWSESRCTASAIQDSKHGTLNGIPVSSITSEVSGKGYGLMQWDGGRRAKMLAMAKQKGVDWTDAAFQINDMFATEITIPVKDGGEKNSFTTYGGIYKGKYSSWDDFKNTSDLNTATLAFAYCIERFGDKSSANARCENAKSIYKMLIEDGLANEPIDSTAASGSSGSTEQAKKLAEDGSSKEPFYGYFDAGYINFGQDHEITAAMYDELIKASNERKTSPLPYMSNVSYGSRYYSGPFHLRIGDSCFTIPPEFINISHETNSQAIMTIRQESSQKLKNGYSKRVISIDLVFHGKSQINGYQVQGPEGWYYVDGLRPLLAQFKCTPFLPIVNYTINYTHGIYNVALQSIVVSTVPGYPELMNAHLTLHEADLSPYIECHNVFFQDMIDWDLFRFYYQRQLSESGEYGKLHPVPQLSEQNQIKLSVLNPAVFSSGMNYQNESSDGITFYDILFDRKIVTEEEGETVVREPGEEEGNPTNFITFLDTKYDDFQITEFHCGYSNMITSLQLADLPHPTMQYMGGMDATFQITMETMDEGVVEKFHSMINTNDSLIRNNRDFTGVGFIKFECELVQLFGTLFIFSDSLITSTVPGFPGLYTIQFNCIGYDAYQKETEAIDGHTPFMSKGKRESTDAYGQLRTRVDSAHKIDGKGYKTDAISQSPEGLKNKTQQDITIEAKMRSECVLYPDLKLPTYTEVDEVISKIRKFRKKNGLSKYPLKTYPKNVQRMAHGIIKGDMTKDKNGFITDVDKLINSAEQYDIIVDPDFYVFYPDTYRRILDLNKDSLEESGLGYTNPVPEAREKIYRTEYTSLQETSDSYVPTGNGNYKNSSVAEFCNMAISHVGKPYTQEQGRRDGPDSFDCSGLVCWCLQHAGIHFLDRPENAWLGTTITLENLANEGNVLYWKARNLTTQQCSDMAEAGDILQRIHGHTGICIGRDENGVNMQVEAKGEQYGVVKHRVIDGTYNAIIGIRAFDGKQGQTSNEKKTSETKGKVKTSAKVKKKKKQAITGTFSTGSSGTEVKKLQKALNSLVDAGLEVDGEYGSKTKEAVRKFQKKWSKDNDPIKMDGIAGKETVQAINSALNKNYSESSSKTETKTSTTKKLKITAAQLSNIAKTMCKKYYGRNESIYTAMAQCIYDRVMDADGKYGSLNNVLSSRLFGKMSEKDINKTPAYACAKAVFCEGNRLFDKRVIYFDGNDVDVKDKSKYTELVSFGKFTFYTDGKKTKSKLFKFNDTTEKNEEKSDAISIKQDDDNTVTVESSVVNGVTEADKSWIKRFGRPVLVSVDEMRSDNSGFLWNIVKGAANITSTGEALSEAVKEVTGGLIDYTEAKEVTYGKKHYNTDDNMLLTAFCNQAEYSAKGKLLKAFPTYFFSIIDEDGAWLDGRKLWGNHYFLRSVVEIQTVSYDDNPVHTATITVSNAYGNLSHRDPRCTVYTPMNDDEYNGLQKTLYDYFGVLPSIRGAKLTNNLVERKNILYGSMLVRAGCRCHLRMGYGSDPLGLPVVFNGFLTDVTVGDIMSFMCVSDGQELMNDIISDNPKNVNGLFKSQESSNMCMDLLTKRTSFLNAILPIYFENNKYGIEHFGLYFSEHCEFIADTGTVADAAGLVIEGITTMVARLGSKILYNGWTDTQFDLIKNIYRGNYKASLAMYSGYWGFMDGEKNIVFSQYNKTPWDVIQVSAQNVTEYIGYPLYHQFESRLFLGLPYWLAKYRYDIINGEVFDEAKTMAQVHFIDSMTDIIDNQMKCTRKGVDTNAIVMYTRGKSPVATPTLYSDRTMDPSYQSTKIYDSSVSQNIIGPDALWDFLGYHQGEDGAVRLGISQLLINWAKAYKGDIIILGDAGIFPNDYIYLNDRFNNISGLCTARCVTNTLSVNQGFITTVTPGMIGFSTKANSQGEVVLSNYISICSAFTYFSNIKKCLIDMSPDVTGAYSFSRDIMFGFVSEYDVLRGTLNAIGMGGYLYGFGKIGAYISDNISTFKALKKAGELGEFYKSFDSFKDAVKVFNTTLDTLDTIGDIAKLGAKGIGAIRAGLKGGFGAIKALKVALPAKGFVGIAIGLLIDILLDKIIDYFEYKHCVTLMPLMRNNMAYIPTTYGEHLVMQNADDNPSYSEADKLYSGDEKTNKSIQTGEDEDYLPTTQDEE